MNPQDAPIPKFGACMVSYGESVLVTFGGYGDLPDNPRTGVDVPNPDNNEVGWTNELIIFDITSSKLVVYPLFVCATLYISTTGVCAYWTDVTSGHVYYNIPCGIE